MTVVSKKTFMDLIAQNPNGGIVFAELYDGYNPGEPMVTDGEFGATCVVPKEGEVFDWDWNIKESSSDDLFVIFDDQDVLQMIQILTKGLSLKIKYEWE